MGKQRLLHVLVLACAGTGLVAGNARAQATQPDMGLVLNDLYQADPQTRSRAVSQLQRLAREEPGVLAANLETVLPALIDAKLPAEAITVTDGLLPQACGDALALFRITQTRSEAFRLLNKPAEALSAARAAFNVAPPAQYPAACDLLLDTVGRQDPAGTLTGDVTKALADGATHVETTAPAWLAKLPGAADERAIRPVARSNFDRLIARGNLLLLANQPTAAQAAFLSAAAGDAKGKKLRLALDGVLRSVRAASGASGPADGLLLAIRTGSACPQLDAMFPRERWRGPEFLDVAYTLPLSTPRAAPSLVARLAGMRAEVAAVTDHLVLDDPPSELLPDEQALLASALAARETSETLALQMTYGLSVAGSGDDAWIAGLYSSVADKLDAANLQRPEAMPTLRMLDHYMNDYKTVLWRQTGDGQLKACLTLRRLYEALARTQLPDARHTAVRKQAVIGTLSCLARMGESERALQIAAKTDFSSYSDLQRAEVDLLTGLLLSESGKPHDAAAKFLSASRTPGYDHAVTARKLYVYALAEADDQAALTEGANFANDQHLSMPDAYDFLAGVHQKMPSYRASAAKSGS